MSADGDAGRRARRPRAAWPLALLVSLGVHAVALAALSTVVFTGQGARAPAERTLVLELRSLPAADAEPVATGLPALQPPRAPSRPEPAEDGTLAEAAEPEPEVDDARWLFEVLAEARVRDELAPRRPAPAPSAQSPVPRASEWQGPPAPPVASREPSAASAPGTTVLAPVPLADNPPPDYPVEARRAGEEGLVIVRARVLPAGSVADVELVQSAGHARLDDAALDAVAAWRFQPALENGRAVEQSIELPIRFRLRSR